MKYAHPSDTKNSRGKSGGQSPGHWGRFLRVTRLRNIAKEHDLLEVFMFH